MSELTLAEAMEEISSAEDFLIYFGIPFDATVVHVNRLHIMQRFHDYLEKGYPTLPEDEEPLRQIYRSLLERSYLDFVNSDSLTEKVFKVFHMHEPSSGFVSVEQLLGNS
jgi:nitrogenase-stabilizing/protective protein